MKATICKNEIPVESHVTLPDREALTISCPAGWDDVQNLTGKVLAYAGKKYTFRGWDSDRNVAFFAAPLNGEIPVAVVL